MRKTKPTRKKSVPKTPAIGSLFGRKLQEARLAHGSSQKQVAARINTNVTTVSRYEIGAVLPSVAMAAQLARAVNASLDQLAGLAEDDGELVVIARTLSPLLGDEHRAALTAHLRALLDLAQGK